MHPRMLTGLGLGVSVLLVTSGCVTRGTHEELRAAYDATAAERDGLKRRVDTLALENASLDERLTAALDELEDRRLANDDLSQRVNTLETDRSELSEELDVRSRRLEETAAALAAREAEIARLQSSYDGLVADLETEVASGQIEIERLREGLRMNVSDDVLFAPGSAELDPIGEEVLRKVAKQIASLDDLVEIRGHTDDRRIRGKLADRYPTNWELAGARAARVVRLLQGAGIPGERMMAVSIAEHQPKAPNDTPEGRALNRRIEIRLRPDRGADLRDEAAPTGGS